MIYMKAKEMAKAKWFFVRVKSCGKASKASMGGCRALCESVCCYKCLHDTTNVNGSSLDSRSTAGALTNSFLSMWETVTNKFFNQSADISG